MNQHTMLEYAELLIKISQSIVEKETELELLDLILEEMMKSFKHLECGCILVNDHGILKMESQIGYTEEAKAAFAIAVEESYYYRYSKGVYDKVHRINQIDLINEEDYTKVAESLEGEDMLSSISAPIVIDGDLYGLINFDSKYQHAFTSEQEEILEYVRHQLALAIKNMKLYEKVIQLSRYDQLTGLYNRHYFESMIKGVIESAFEQGQNVVIVVCDLDYLKKINDENGHVAGDEALVNIGGALKKAMPNAFVARFGGDEFIAASIGVPYAQVKMSLNHQRQVLADTYYGKWQLGFSMGLVEATEKQKDYASLLRRADQAMYKDKAARNLKRRETDEWPHDED